MRYEENKKVTEELYDELISGKIKPIIYQYDIQKNDGKVVEYHPYRHICESDKPCDSGNIEQQIVDILFDSIPFYAYEYDEIAIEHEEGRFENLKKLALTAYNMKLPHYKECKDYNDKTSNCDKCNHNGSNYCVDGKLIATDGMLGELILEILLRTYYSTNMIMSRVKYSSQNPTKYLKSETKGYDAIMFSQDESKQISMWLGQVKAGRLDYCVKSIKEDINKNILPEYFAGWMAIVADAQRTDKESDLQQVIKDINRLVYDNLGNKEKIVKPIIKYFVDKKIKIIMPSAIIYSPQSYDSCENIIEDINKICKSQLSNINIKNSGNLDISIQFVVFPVRNINLLKYKLYEIREGVKNKEIECG